MSKDLHHNERYLKELADKYKPVPPPLVWDEIEQALDKDNRKRRLFLLLWLLGVVVLGAVLFISLKVKKDKESPIVEQAIIISGDQKQSALIPQDIGSVDAEAIDEKKQNANSLEKIRTVSDTPEEEEVASEKLKSSVPRQHQSNHLNTSGPDRSLSAITINANTTALTNREDIVRPRTSTPSTFEAVNTPPITPLQPLKWARRPLVSSLSLPDPSDNLTAILVPEAKSNALHASPWFVALGGGIGKNLSRPVSITPTQGGFRLNTESNWYSWSASMQLGYQFAKHWYTTIGFDLNQTKSRFDFWRRDINSLIVSEDQSFQITNTDFFSIGETKYTFADIGLSFGRRVSIDKWHFSLEGGAIFNLLFNANGKVQVGDLEFSRLEDQEEYFNTQIGIGVRLSAMLDYPIADQLWIAVGPSYHQYFETVSSEENPLREQNSILQVMAKVRYGF